jgi:hypothetical protein
VHATLAGLPFLRGALELTGVIFIEDDHGEGLVK